MEVVGEAGGAASCRETALAACWAFGAGCCKVLVVAYEGDAPFGGVAEGSEVVGVAGDALAAAAAGEAVVGTQFAGLEVQVGVVPIKARAVAQVVISHEKS